MFLSFELAPDQRLGLLHDAGACTTYQVLPTGLDEEYYCVTEPMDGDHLWDNQRWFIRKGGSWARAVVGGCVNCAYGQYVSADSKPRNLLQPGRRSTMPTDGDIAWTGHQHMIYLNNQWVLYDQVVKSMFAQKESEERERLRKIEEMTTTELDSVVIGDTKVVLMADGRLLHQPA